MTRDEILKMEAGRELDALVAEKVMGIPVKIGVITGEPYHAKFGYLLPEYSHNIKHAWEVLDKVKSGDPMVTFNSIDNKWLCGIWFKSRKQASIAYADTVPLAICRAALLATISND